MQIRYIPKIGKFAGLVHQPYKNSEGFYIVSKDRFKENYINVATIHEVHEYVKQGLGVRMQYEKNPASLIKLDSLKIS